MIEENLVFEEKVPQLSSRTLSYYGTHQRENRSEILYMSGNPFIAGNKYDRLKANYIFHVYLQLTTLIDYVNK
jgi:hypothetical protein